MRVVYTGADLKFGKEQVSRTGLYLHVDDSAIFLKDQVGRCALLPSSIRSFMRVSLSYVILTVLENLIFCSDLHTPGK